LASQLILLLKIKVKKEIIKNIEDRVK